MKNDFDRKEAEDLIGRAAEIDHDASEKLSHAEVVTAAREVGVSEAAVHAAEQEKERAEIARAQRVARWKRNVTMASVLIVLALLSFQVAGMFARSRLAAAWQNVQMRHADVRSAMQRRDTVVAFWGSRDLGWCAQPSPACYQIFHDRDVEIAGAQNRITVAIRRYDIAARGYNDLTQSNSWGPFNEFPQHAPYSNELTRW